MSSTLFDESEDELDFKIDNPFAKNYDKWRRKEELHKLQTKYGPDASLPDSESSESESEDEHVQLSEEFEKNFLKTLSLLKNKDPRIYDSTFKFFDNDNVHTANADAAKNVRHNKPVTVRDYERRIILNKDKLDDEDSNDNHIESKTYVEEQRQLKENLKSFLKDEEKNESDDEDLAGMFKKRTKTEKEKEEEEQSHREWLKGQNEHLNDEKEEQDLRALKQFWSQPNLDEKDAFLRDYILDRRYLETDDNINIPSYDEIVHDSEGNLSDDEATIKQQVTFERKFNFRFEEPDPEFIKKYPRTIESSMRPQSNKRALKRHEIKERKAEEKKKKFEEIGRLKAMKLKEIQEKIAKLKEITGNDELAFQEEDIMEDFDPESHDKRMKELFDNTYYQEPEGVKPEFPDLDEELEIENWDKYEDECEQPNVVNSQNHEPHCEDENFNMDCDYNANEKKEEIHELGPKRRRRKRKSKLAEILATEKPKYDPMHVDKTTYSEYMDEYYKIDCEDIIGDLPCRFKYVETVPNDYGLSIEEILLADDKELNQWYSLKRSLKNKPEYQELGEVKAYKKRAENIKLKRKYLPSLFRNIPEDPEDRPDVVAVNNDPSIKKKKKKKKKKIKNTQIASTVELQNGDHTHELQNAVVYISVDTKIAPEGMPKKVKNKQKNQIHSKATVVNIDNGSQVGNVVRAAESKILIQPKKKTKKKKKILSTNGAVTTNNKEANHNVQNNTNKSIGDKEVEGAKKNRKRKISQVHGDASSGVETKAKKQKMKNKNQKHGFRVTGAPKKPNNDPLHSLTDERLKAYGLNPKKYKNFLKYKKF